MGLGSFLFGLLGAGGSGRNVVSETVEAFRPNAEKEAQRRADYQNAALQQYAAEFHARSNRTWLDALADGLNRLVRPVVTLGLFIPIVMSVRDPANMAQVWTAIATLPHGYWAVVGIVLPFYFGGRMQMKALEAAKWTAAAAAAGELVRGSLPGGQAEAAEEGPNPALDDWQAGGG